MPERAIHLSDETWTALERSATAHGKSISQLVEESLKAAGVLSNPKVTSLLDDARTRAGLSEDEALALAVAETRAVRRQARA